MSASTIMSLIDENAHHLPDGVYLKLCNELKNLHQGSKNNRKALSFTDYNDQTQYVCCQSLMEFDEFIRWVEEAMRDLNHQSQKTTTSIICFLQKQIKKG